MRNALRHRKGAAVTEFAIVLPVLVVFTLVGIEIGSCLITKQQVVNVSREGARAFAREGNKAQAEKAVAEAMAAVRPHLRVNGNDPIDYSAEYTLNGKAATVTVHVNAAEACPFPPFITRGYRLDGSSTMRVESN